jgi:hypothetical protein
MFLPFLPEIPGRSAITIERTTEPKCQMRLPEQEGGTSLSNEFGGLRNFPTIAVVKILDSNSKLSYKFEV